MREPHLSRRRFLLGAGTAIALPLLPSLLPRSAWAGDPPEAPQPPLRMLFLAEGLGFTPAKMWNLGNDGWVPVDDGRDYRMSDVNAALEPHRADISWIKGIRHQQYRGDTHFADDVFLTGADTMADPSRGFCNTVSCDQVAAEAPHFGDGVRYRSLALGVPPIVYSTSRSGGLSWTRQGLPVTPLQSPAQVFDQLFGTDEVPTEERLLRLQEKRSILDATLEQYRRIERTLNDDDRRKLDEVATAVRDVEAKIQHEQDWIATPKPKVDLAQPDRTIEPCSYRQAEVMFDLIHAAFLTDSTRVITYHLPVLWPKTGNSGGHHGMIHGNTPEEQQMMLENDRAIAERMAHLLARMKASTDHDGQPLLYRTLGALGAGGWGSLHSMERIPVMLFGHGGGKLAQGFSRTYDEHVPFANIWLTLLRVAGVQADRFADSTGVLPEMMA